jgi:hypothetical protein
MSKIALTFLLAIFFIAFIGCEGPKGAAGAAGTDGTDGLDGADGNVTCLVCHSDGNLQAIRHQFAGSQHALGEYVAYAGGRGSCSRCHGHEGFVAFAEGLEAQNFSNPSPWQCSTCHGLHQTFEAEDYALRMTEAVSIWDDGTFALKGNSFLGIQGNSNLCANCHQSRRAEPNLASPGETFTITSTHYGPHHSAAANTVAGAGFAEIVGSVAYPAAGSNYHLAASCTGCHMYEGDHSWNPSLEACNGCHATNDFDYGGVQTEIEELLDELRDRLIVLGVVEPGHDEEFVIDQETGEVILHETIEGYHPVPGTYPMAQARAFFNWTGLDEDRSLGVHNPKYVKALLENSLDSIE